MVLNIAFQLVLLVLLVSQSSSTTIRTGDVSRQLTEKDIAALKRSLPPDAKPWLLNGDPSQAPGEEFIEAYLSPTTATSTLRRGPFIVVVRRIAPLPLTEWTVRLSGTYAQVAIPGREFDQIQGDQDINRPFKIIGNFDDTELTDLVTFLRSSPPTTGVNAIQPWPILSIRRADGAVEVMLRGAVMKGQMVTVRRTERGWTIIRVGTWIV
jgi:hypothetical protein